MPVRSSIARFQRAHAWQIIKLCLVRGAWLALCLAAVCILADLFLALPDRERVLLGSACPMVLLLVTIVTYLRLISADLVAGAFGYAEVFGHISRNIRIVSVCGRSQSNKKMRLGIADYADIARVGLKRCTCCRRCVSHDLYNCRFLGHRHDSTRFVRNKILVLGNVSVSHKSPQKTSLPSYHLYAEANAFQRHSHSPGNSGDGTAKTNHSVTALYVQGY